MADILNVVPASGSIEGGTTITVTTSVNLNNYRADEVEVYVGGVCVCVCVCVRATACYDSWDKIFRTFVEIQYPPTPGRECRNVVLIGNGSIQCTTPSQPPSLPYYPGTYM